MVWLKISVPVRSENSTGMLTSFKGFLLLHPWVWKGGGEERKRKRKIGLQT
jgi:hypothetical protein